MTVLITAGSVSERIDSVRSIVNTASGRLGALTAEAVARLGGTRVSRIIYLAEASAAEPTLPGLVRVVASGALDVAAKLEKLLRTERPDAVVHSMAVSDYVVEAVLDADGNPGIGGDGKLPSDLERLTVALRRAPKIIASVKDLCPETFLVGFKLLDRVPREELIRAALGILRKNRCGLVLANDLGEISGDAHAGYLVRPDGSYERVEGKARIAEALARALLAGVEERNAR